MSTYIYIYIYTSYIIFIQTQNNNNENIPNTSNYSNNDIWSLYPPKHQLDTLQCGFRVSRHVHRPGATSPKHPWVRATVVHHTTWIRPRDCGVPQSRRWSDWDMNHQSSPNMWWYMIYVIYIYIYDICDKYGMIYERLICYMISGLCFWYTHQSHQFSWFVSYGVIWIWQNGWITKEW